MYREFLRVKIKSLAAEAAIIHKAERRVRDRWRRKAAKYAVEENTPLGDDPLYHALRQHRILEVRRECRSALLAYGFLRGRSYAWLEAKCYEEPDLDRVEKLVCRFSDIPQPDAKEDLALWRYGKEKKQVAA